MDDYDIDDISSKNDMEEYSEFFNQFMVHDEHIDSKGAKGKEKHMLLAKASDLVPDSPVLGWVEGEGSGEC